jgi:hypothetical protein
MEPGELGELVHGGTLRNGAKDKTFLAMAIVLPLNPRS